MTRQGRRESKKGKMHDAQSKTSFETTVLQNQAISGMKSIRHKSNFAVSTNNSVAFYMNACGPHQAVVVSEVAGTSNRASSSRQRTSRPLLGRLVAALTASSALGAVIVPVLMPAVAHADMRGASGDYMHYPNETGSLRTLTPGGAGNGWGGAAGRETGNAAASNGRGANGQAGTVAGDALGATSIYTTVNSITGGGWRYSIHSGSQRADSDDRAHVFQSDGAQHSDLIARTLVGDRCV